MRRSIFVDARPIMPPVPVRHDLARATHLPTPRPGVSYGVAALEEEIRRLDAPSTAPRCASPWCRRAPRSGGLCAICGGTEVRDGR